MEENVEENDRISGLPVSIRFRILSHLDMMEVIQTGFLSSKWRNIWKYVTNLSFDYRIWKKTNEGNGNLDVDTFLEFVDRVLFLRESGYIQRFHLSIPPINGIGKMIESFMLLSMNGLAEEIHLDIFETGRRTLRRTVKLPEILFSSSTIRFFKVDASKAEAVTVILPKSLCSARHLKSLELVSVLLPQSYIGDLFMNFPVLENLILKDCCGDFQLLSITAPQLRILTVVNLEGKIAISTPNLRSCQIDGYHYDDCYVEEDLSLLVSAHLDVPTRCMLQILKEFHNARTLTLSNWDPESPSSVFVRLEWLQKPFQNLRYLKVRDVSYYNPYCLDAVGKLLQRSPYLESLVLEIRARKTREKDDTDREKNRYRVQDWGALLSFDCKFSHLRSCEMKNVSGSKAELEFLERLLGCCAQDLERITLSPNIHLLTAEKNMLGKFHDKLSKLSPNSTIQIGS